MIIGKDKERVRQLEIECKLARELIETVRSDMESIRDYLYNDTVCINIADDPLWRLSNDIGRCSGHLNYFK